MAARKEAMMKSVRNELALANAQELINVRECNPDDSEVLLFSPPENKREMFSQVHSQAGDFVVVIRTDMPNKLLGSVHGGL
jgi:hypothetical protein